VGGNGEGRHRLREEELKAEENDMRSKLKRVTGY
jgi:hypothetical protein